MNRLRLPGLFGLPTLGVALSLAQPAVGEERDLTGRLWEQYGALLPPPAPSANNTPPTGCADRSSIDEVVRGPSSHLAFIVHSRHFHCVQPQYGVEWSSYSSALSVVDEGAATPVLLHSTPLADPLNGANDVVDWSASLRTFRLSATVDGLAVNVGGTISGSGVMTDSTEFIFAVVAGAEPKLLLSVPGAGFGKSNIENAGGQQVALSVTRVRAGTPTFFGVVTSPWATVDGVEQDVPSTSELYRFEPKGVALQKVSAAPVAASAWLPIAMAPR